MSQFLNTAINLNPAKLILLDVHRVFEDLEFHPTAASLLPWVEIRDLVMLGLAAPIGPGTGEYLVEWIMRMIPPYVNKEPFLSRSEDIESLVWSVSTQIDGCLMYHGGPVGLDIFKASFWKWVDHHTVAINYHHEPTIVQWLLEEGRRRVEYHLAQKAASWLLPGAVRPLSV